MIRFRSMVSRLTLRGVALAGAVVLMLSAGGALAFAGGQGDDLGPAGDGGGVARTATPTPSSSPGDNTGDDDNPDGDDSATGEPATDAPADDDPGEDTGDDGPDAGKPATGSDPDPAGIDVRRAGRIALAYTGGGTVTELEREHEHGRLEWKVEVTRGRQHFDVRVDATTGAVTRVDDEGHEDDERDDDDRGRGHDRDDDRDDDDRDDGDDHDDRDDRDDG